MSSAEVYRAQQPRPRPVASEAPPLLSVLVPAFNEERTLAEIVRRVAAVPLAKEILVVDDGSTDDSWAIIKELAETHHDLVALRHPQNLGKGAAIRTALEHARGDLTIVQDADLEYDPADYPALIAPILERRTNVVYGSRPLEKSNRYPIDRFRMGSFAMTWIANVLYGRHITDEATCYKVMRTDLLRSLDLRSRGFEFCAEVTAKLMRRRERIVEVPIHYRGRTVAEGKKIGWRDAFHGAWTLLKYRFRR